MATIKATLQNLKNNGWTYYPVLIGGKLHINRDGNLYMLVRNDTHDTRVPVEQSHGCRVGPWGTQLAREERH